MTKDRRTREKREYIVEADSPGSARLKVPEDETILSVEEAGDHE